MAVKNLQRLASYAGLARDAYKLNRTDDQQVRRQVRRHLIQRMGKLRGLPQKLGQLMSLSHDDEEAAEDYALLQEKAEPLPFEIIKPIIEKAWGKPLEDVLVEIDPVGLAASLGQVHRARTLEGVEVAIKVQYPDIREKVVADLSMLGWLSIPVGNLHRGFDLTQYRQVILDDIDRELDYKQEALSQQDFCRWADESSFLIVPQVILSLSCENVLVTQWEEGDSWNSVRSSWNEDEKRSLAKQLLSWFFDSLFQRRMLHADLHPGNVRFRRNAGGVQMLLYDFGSVYRPSEEESLALLRLIRTSIRRGESPWPIFLKLGFTQEYLEPLASKLPALCQLLFEPFCVEYPYQIPDWNLGERVSDVLGEDRWNFRIAGPPSLVFLLKAFHNLKYYLEGLDSRLFWRKAIHPYLDRYGEDMDRLDLPSTSCDTSSFSSLARYLKIRVRENGRTKVELTSYAHGIDDLGSLLEEDLKDKIELQGINLDEIVAGVRRRGYAPGPVFELEDAGKRITVWLE